MLAVKRLRKPIILFLLLSNTANVDVRQLNCMTLFYFHNYSLILPIFHGRFPFVFAQLQIL